MPRRLTLTASLLLIVALWLLATPAAIASITPGQAGLNPEYMPDRIVVSLSDTAVSTGDLDAHVQAMASPALGQLNAKYGVIAIEPLYRLAAETRAAGSTSVEQQTIPSNTYLLTITSGDDPSEAAAEYARAPGVRYAEPDYICYALRTDPNDSYWAVSNSWGQGYRDQWDMEIVNCPAAWDIQRGSPSVVIAVVDSGVDYNHPDLAQNMWHNPGEIAGNGIDDDGNGKTDDLYGCDFFNNDADPVDDHGHGTHCAGTIGAVGNNALGIAGMNWNCKVMAVKGLGSAGWGSSTALAAGIRYAADEGADVISLSWGGSGGSHTIHDALAYAHDVRGAVLVVAAGNQNSDITGFHPAGDNNAITVAASDQNDAKCSFSNYGVAIAVSAPGGGPNLATPAYAMYNCLSLRSATAPVSAVLSVGADCYRSAGTSMACPHVSGLAALVFAQHPSWTNEQVRQAIQMQADDILTTGHDRYSGYGRINAYRSLVSPEPTTAFISAPANAATIGVVDVMGTACGPGFSSYTLDCGLGAAPTVWKTIITSATPVVNGLLAAWNSGNLAEGDYTLRLRTTGTGGAPYSEHRIQVTVVSPCGSGHYTELFTSNSPFDLSDTSLTFVPDGSPSYYSLFRQPISSLPTDPAGGMPLSLSDDSSQAITLSDGAQVSLYGFAASTFHVGSNGYITLGSEDSSSTAGYVQHFALRRISALFCNLVPAAGSVTWKQLSDRAAVTFQNVPQYGTSNSSTFQIEMFFSGRIVVSYLGVAATSALAGLSSGQGTPPGFSQTDLSACGTLGAFPRSLSVISPNGGEQYEPGQIVPVAWTTAGAEWLPGDQISLESSSDGGANWIPMAGASSLPYNAGLFQWNTAGLTSSTSYRVRAVCNADASVNDASAANFTIAADLIAPVIAHTPLADTGSKTGPYVVSATVTDNVGVSSVSLHYSKNGGAFASMPMVSTGEANEYSGSIPGPAAIGDTYHYYIVATDLAAQCNTARSPSSADYSFSITSAVIDTLGAYVTSAMAPPGSRGNVFACTSMGFLNQIEQYLNASASTELRFFVYESTSVNGTYSKISETTQPSCQTGLRWHSSGRLSVPLVAGRYYIIGAAWHGSTTYYYAHSGHPIDVNFGSSQAGYVTSVYPPPTTTTNSSSTNVCHQRLTSTLSGRAVAVASPNGGEHYEPGVIPVTWTTTGLGWLPGDSVRLEYSSDGGTNWYPVAGASLLPYDAPAFSWDTTGFAASGDYRVRVVCNADVVASDASNSSFAIAPDLTPPVIAHTPLSDSGLKTGPYPVRATVTDNIGILSVTLYYSKNGAAFTSVPMIRTGASTEYSGDIIGPSVIGDNYRYYIVATDTAAAHNTSRSPVSDEYRFAIIDQIEVLSYIQYSDNSSTGEYKNTLKAIQATYPIRNTELTDHTQLATAMVGKQVLLVPEQELSNLSQMLTVGAAWKATLESFLESGGRIVVCDFAGGSYGLLSGAGLMAVSPQGGVAGQSVHVSDASSPFVSGVGSPYTAASASCSFVTSETGVIVATAGGAPVAVAKPVSAGYVVLIGHDYFNSNNSQDRLVANAVGTVVGKVLSLRSPCGGEHYEPGQIASIRWAAFGNQWPSDATVKLEYSSNGGADWNLMPGASSLPYNAFYFDWDTTGLEISNRYRVRVVYNADAAVSDTSDADFTVAPDLAPPVISHVPLLDTWDRTGPYIVSASVTDQTQVSSVELHISKNGGAFTSVPMSLSPADGKYYGSIPGPSVFGDTYRYFIVATDAALARNTSRAPTSGEYAFKVIVTTTDTVGDSYYSGNVSNHSRGNVFACTSSSVLRQIEHYLAPDTSTELRFLVYESTSVNGVYTKISETVLPSSGTGLKWYSSGPIAVPLIVGRYYMIGAAWQGYVGYRCAGSGHPVAVSFGASVAGYGISGYPPSTSATYVGGAYVDYQRLTSSLDGRGLAIVSPNGGEQFEPGQPVPVKWITTGLDWLPGEMLRLEYSLDGGANWIGVAGASSVPRDSALFTWDTTGLASGSYRLRAVCDANPGVTDVSDGTFTIATDLTAPVVAHTPLSETGNRTGPYTVRATITDNVGLGSVLLYYSKNGGAFASVAMTTTGTPNEYAGDIQGPSALGDTYRYYILATDSSAARNASRSPSAGSYEFGIVARVIDTVGAATSESTWQTAASFGNFFACNSMGTLNQIEQYLDPQTGGEMRFYVYESTSTSLTSTFTKVSETVLPNPGTDRTWYSSGPISVPLTAGRFYIIGVAFQGYATYFYESCHPTTVNFGAYQTGCKGVGGYPPPATTTYSVHSNSNIYHQRISSTLMPRWLTLNSPNGGEHYDPGQATPVTWTAAGLGWLPGDTVRLEYSLDAGTSWRPAAGASSLAYNAGSFAWDTTATGTSNSYRIRVAYNPDATVNDASDANFTIAPDLVAPVITHTPLGDSGNTVGPYTVRATVADIGGVSSVVLYYSKNNGAFLPVSMAGTATANEYAGDIPGPSARGDNYRYYIVATDSAAAHNAARSPATGFHSFEILSAVTDTIGSPVAMGNTAGYSRGNVFQCSSTALLRQIEQYLDVSSPNELRFFVHEATSATGTYTKISETVQSNPGTGQNWYSSGRISVPLVAGRYYIIGTACQGRTSGYYASSGHPDYTNFGSSLAGYSNLSYPPPTTAYNAGSQNVYYQRLTSSLGGRWLTLVAPNGGERYELGRNAPVSWTTVGPGWSPADTVSIWYSDGTTWNTVPGASSVPYQASSFSWNTTWLTASENYRVRVTCNSDDTATDISDGYFAMEQDLEAPVIAHTPVVRGGTGGPYSVVATVTDNLGAISSVVLYYSRNGGAFTSVPMSATGNANEYSTSIPGPSDVGDNYQYYIEATDAASTPNTSRSPASGSYSFDIIDAIKVLAYTQYADKIAAKGYQNTLGAIRAVYPVDVTEFADPASLGSAIIGKQVLLVPEQHHGTGSNMQAVGTAWRPILQGFLASGGRIVVCDSNCVGTYRILTGAGLMSIDWQAGAGGQNLQVSDPDSPFAAGVVSPYTAASDGCFYTTGETGAIVTTAYGAPVVIAKSVSAGHVVLIGHDYTTSNPSQDALLANAVGAAVRALNITSPNGGEQYEPGQSIHVTWFAVGMKWVAGDTVRLEFSEDDGASWSEVPGASSLPYDAGHFDWDTAGVAPSSFCRIRVVCNVDAATNDASDGSFMISADHTAPVIAHAALPDTGNTTGPYQVSATVTDNTGISSVALCYSKNGAEFVAVPMTVTGAANQYSGDIPGPSVLGDSYRYYITATDLTARNTSRSPASEYYSFSIVLAAADKVGAPAVSDAAAASARGNVYACAYTGVLREIEQYLNPVASTELRFVVYESTSYNGTYARISETVRPSSGTGAGWYNSGPISVPLVAGRYYIISAAWQGIAYFYFKNNGQPANVSFGTSQAAYSASGYPPSDTATHSGGRAIYHQRLTSSLNGRHVFIGSPNGGERVEPGQVVRVAWAAAGLDWLLADTVRLEYSPDSGATWNAIPGAGSLPCCAGVFDWQTAGLSEANSYRVKAIYNGDGAVSDASDADFTMALDRTPPVVTHTPLADTLDKTGPYTVRATATDEMGISSVVLYYSRNGGAFTSLPMTATGTANQYSCDIPGPGAPEDVYEYYIAATDLAAAHNMSRAPASDNYSFSIIKEIEVLSYVQYTSKSSGAEYDWTLNAVESACHIRNTELSDYTQLETAIVGKDVLLVPVQNWQATPAQMQTIGRSWQPVLQSFLAAGGRIVVCDYGSGGTYGLLTGAGLMSISASSSTTGTLQVVDPASPFAAGVASPYSWYSSFYSTGEKGVIVATAGGAPVVIAEHVSAGYAILIGHSYLGSSASGSPERLLANAVGAVIDRDISIAAPNGGEKYRPGDSIPITWRTDGRQWKAGDRVRLEYSADGGVRWNRIAGAANLHYSSGPYNWSTTGLAESANYRVRVAFNDDQDRSVTDASDADVAIAMDITPPTIAHTPIADTGSTGPYTIRATAADEAGVSSVTLFYSRNGGVETSLPMTAAGEVGVYAAKIPGPAVAGDTYHYHITASDGSLARNTSRSPASADHVFQVVAAATNTVGSQASIGGGGPGYSIGNVFACTSTVTLHQIEHYLYPGSSTELRFFVFESASQGGTFTKISETVQTGAVGQGWHSSGPVSVRLTAGRHYLIGVGWQGIANCYYATGHPVAVAFGSSQCGYSSWTYPPPATTTTGLNTSVYYQRLITTVVPRNLTISIPNGGELYEPGAPVAVAWAEDGPGWAAGDTVKIDYSSDSGASWNPIAGAESLAYNAGSFSWDTTGLAVLGGYRVRVSYNADATVSCASNADFALAIDTTPPGITHAPLKDSSSTAGPYTVKATVTDNMAVSSVTCYYSRNGGELSSVAMTATGTANQYTGDIPGPSAFGDVYRYHIVAADAAFAHNTTRSPASGDHSFTVKATATDTIGGMILPATTTGRCQGNVFSCACSVRLDQIEAYLRVNTSTELKFVVYEATSLDGAYTKISETTLPSSGTGPRWYGSGPISVPLVAGRYYIIGTAWKGSATSYSTPSGHPANTNFGASRSGYSSSTYPPVSGASSPGTATVYFQRLTSTLVEAIPAQTSGSIAELKANAQEGELVRLTGPAAVTYAPRDANDARTTNYFYIGDTSATGCIRVVDAAGDDLQIGNAVAGLVGLVSKPGITGEWRLQLIADPVAIQLGASDALRPIAPLGLNGTSASNDTIALTNAVKVWGRVGSMSGGGFTVNDGWTDLDVIVNGIALPGDLSPGRPVVVKGILTKNETGRRVIYAQEVNAVR